MIKHLSIIFIALVFIIVLAPTAAQSDDFVWDAGADGGYFDSGAWDDLDPIGGNNGSYPGELGQDQLAVNDGWTVTLTLSDPRAATLFFLNSMNIGGGDFGQGFPTVEGHFVIDGSGVPSAVFDRGRFYIGDAQTDDLSATGSLTTIQAGVSALGFVVGRNMGTDLASSANGTATIDGALAGSSVFVGTTIGPTGTAHGEVEAKSLNVDRLFVGNASAGVAGGDATGMATGRVSITAGDAVVHQFLSVGATSDSGAVADGEVKVTNGNLIYESSSSVFGLLARIGSASTTFFGVGAQSATGWVEANAFQTLRDPGETGIGVFSVGTATGTSFAGATGLIGAGTFLTPGRTGNAVEFDPGTPVQVGVAGRGGTANGTVEIGDALKVIVADQLDQRDLQVGVITGGDPGEVSTAIGTATVGGLHDFRGFDVGVVIAGEGTATGNLALGEDGYRGLFLNSRRNRIGATLGAGDGVGELIVTGGDVLTGGGLTGFNVGYAAGGSGLDDIGDATGTMRVLGGSLRPRDDIDPAFAFPPILSIGRAELQGSQSSSATGIFEFDASGGPKQAMTVSSLVVGSSFTEDSSVADVMGTATVRNADVTANNIAVGQSFDTDSSTARVKGSLTFEDSTVAVSFVTVGQTFLSSANTEAEGRLALRNSTMTVDGSMFVANDPFGRNSTHGFVDLDHSRLSVSERLSLGAGSEVLFHMDGFDRGTSFGAIDVGETAMLGGTALIDFGDSFDFVSAKQMLFDLIVADSFLDNQSMLVLTAFADVVFEGLAPGFVATTSYVNEGGHDIFRLMINDAPAAVPLPPSFILFATGLGALGLLGWRRKRKQAAA